MLQLVVFHVLLSLTLAPAASAQPDIGETLASLSETMDDRENCPDACQEENAHRAAVIAVRLDVGPWQRREAAVLAVEAWLRRAENEPSRVYACAAHVLAERIEVDREFFGRISALARRLGAENCDEPALEAAAWVESAPPRAAWVGAWLASEVWRRRAVSEKQPELLCDAARVLRRYRARPDAIGGDVLEPGEPRSCRQLLPVAGRRPPPVAAPGPRPARHLELAGGLTAAVGGVMAAAGLTAGLLDMAAAAGQVGVLTDTAQAAGRPFTAVELQTIEELRADFRTGRSVAIAFGSAGGALLGGGLSLALAGRAMRLRQTVKPWADGRVAGVVLSGAF